MDRPAGWKLLNTMVRFYWKHCMEPREQYDYDCSQEEWEQAMDELDELMALLKDSG